MYEYTIETLTAAGYKHYEISNFAKPDFECRHNINYWKNGNYIGIGAGAHSHVDGKRWANPNCLEAYLGNRPDLPGQVSSPSETIFLGLRLLDGLPIKKFAGFEKEVEELMDDGLLERKNGHYKLTRKGLYLGNLVFEKFV
jgi:oxygen-independent coproporphyrinogen-3 oxidase